MVLMMEEDLDRWFIREIVAHEAALMRYLARCWSDRTEIRDIRQECYIRVYESAAKSKPLSPKSFLFQTARHLMVDHLRRRRVVSIESVEDLDALNVPADELSPERRLSGLQDLRHLSYAFDQLPEKCREVVWLRKVQGLSQREVGAKLHIAETTVEKHMARGIRLLARFLFNGEAARKSKGAAKDSSDANAPELKDSELGEHEF
jgi:RNA polymerase sigma factor (sigma-70 family)